MSARAAPTADALQMIPGFASADEVACALRRTTPELALLALLGSTSGSEFVCIGRDEDDRPTLVVVGGDAFRAWLAGGAASSH